MEKQIENWQITSKELYIKMAELGMKVNTNSEEYKGINTKWFTNKDLSNISYRTINYWDEKGYLNGEKKAGTKWRKFDFYQLIWIHMLDKLRQMGVSIDIVVPHIFNAYGFIPQLNDEQKLSIRNSLKAPLKGDFDKMYGNALNFQTIFRFWVNYATFLKKEVAIRFYSDGSIQTLTEDDILIKQKKSLSFISISVNELINQFLEQKSVEIIGNVEILSSNELEVIKHLRNKEIVELSVTKQNGELIKLESKSVIQDMELNKRLYEYIMTPYEKIEFITNAGKTSTFIRTINKKLN